MIRPSSSSRRGVALVLVLAFLVLISVFVVGFFVSASSELSSSSGYAATVQTQELSETAANVVMGQIREATTRPGEVWASQPGMLRTFRTNQPTSFYKLYSSNQMVVEGQGVKGEASASDYNPYKDVPTGPDTGWNHKPALWVNLNEPVRVALPGSASGVSGALGVDYEYRYPILDPAAFYERASAGDAGNFPPPNLGSTVAEKRVEGAELIREATDDSDKDPSGVDKQTVFTRMPVRWLYVLKDGTLTSPDTDLKGTTAIWNDDAALIASRPSAKNPIVARIAFWADDDTCKVNINTAGGYTTYKTFSTTPKSEDEYAGSYWDSPRFNTSFDEGSVNSSTGAVTPSMMSLAIAQPVRNKFQRYPGHPATTSLGLVFRDLLTSDQLYQLTPRISGGGSAGGTKQLILARGGTKIALDKHDRLYASVDEMLFAVPKVTDALGTPRAQNSTTLAATAFTPELVNRMRFFLTAHSRAPELNVFGRPRVTIWPMWPIYGPAGSMYNTQNGYNAKGSGQKTSRDEFRKIVNDNPTEKLLAFCSTLGPTENDNAVRPYFFQRSNPYSATDDGTIARNQALFTYLVKLMGLPQLGAGGRSISTPATFKDKYPGEKSDATSVADGDYRQIISEIFDYIRCVNLNDTSHDTPAPIDQTPDTPGYKAVVGDPKYKYAPHGYVVPSVVSGILNNMPGYGRFPTVSEAVLVFYHAGYAVSVYNPTSKRNELSMIQDRVTYRQQYTQTDPNGNTILDPNTKEPLLKPGVLGRFVQAFVIFKGFTPMEGYTGESGFDFTSEVVNRGLYFQHECTGLDGFAIKSASMPAAEKLRIGAGGTINRFWDSPSVAWDGKALGGQEGFFHTMYHGFAATPLTGGNTAPSDPAWYPFQSTRPFPLPPGGKDPGPPVQSYMLDAQGNKVYIRTADYSAIKGVFVPIADRTFDFTSNGIVRLNVSFAGTKVSSLDLNFPNATNWPVPTDNLWATPPNSGGGYIHENSNDAAATSSKQMGTYNVDAQFLLSERIRWCRRHAWNPWNQYVDNTNGGPFMPDHKNYGDRHNQLLLPGDTIRSLIPFNPTTTVDVVAKSGMGDPRALALIGISNTLKGKYLQPHPNYLTSIRQAMLLRTAGNAPYIQNRTALEPDFYNNKSTLFDTKFGVMVPNITYQSSSVSCDLPPDVKGLLRGDGLQPDFDTGLANSPDGGFTNKSDEGTGTWRWWDSNNKVWVYALPYYSSVREGGYDTYFSPNKQMPSAVQFGSMLSGRTKHWQTLAFSPNALGSPHPGITKDPKDHYLLDLFTMPVVEPYAISEPLSTAGKVNLNYAMAPFGHIRRSTAMRAALHPVRVIAVPKQDSFRFKSTGTLDQDRNYRFRVNRDETLKAFDDLFTGKSTGHPEIFRTGSQLCEMYLYPNMYKTEGSSGAGGRTPKLEMNEAGGEPKYVIGQNPIKTFWTNCVMTGDNLREKPYNDLYPRITTKSNTYTVHMWVQALKKRSTIGLSRTAADNAQRSWDETKDQVVAEYRGSSTIERYIDPQDRRFDPKNTETVSKNDYVDPDKSSVEALYRFRVVESKRFAP